MVEQHEWPQTYSDLMAAYMEERRAFQAQYEPRPGARIVYAGDVWIECERYWFNTGYMGVPLDTEGRPVVPFRSTGFPSIAALDSSLYDKHYLGLERLCERFITSLGTPTIPVRSASLFFPLKYEQGTLFTLVGVCTEGKEMEGYLVPIGEKIQQEDQRTLYRELQREEPDITFYSLFHSPSPIWGSIARGIVEEIGPMSIKDRGIVEAELFLAPIRFVFFDLKHRFINFPILKPTGDQFSVVLDRLIGKMHHKEWAEPLRWISVEILQEETYQGYPIPQGVRFVAGHLLDF